MDFSEKEYLNKITSAIALTLNEDHSIRFINDFGQKKINLTGKQPEVKNIKRITNSTISSIENGIDHISSEHWEKFFNAIPMPVFIKDRQHRWIFFNDALCQLQRKTRQELQNKNDYDFFPKTQADRFWKEEEAIFQTGKEFFAEEPSLRNGADSYVLIKKTIVRTSDGSEYLIGCCIDITQRKQAELALIENERRFRTLIRHSPDIIVIVGKDHLIRYLTPSFYRLFGFGENEVVGTSILDLIHQQDKDNYLSTISNTVSLPLKGVNLEMRLRKKNGDYVILDSFIKDLSFDPAIDGIVINCSDVTMVRNQSAEIERINKLLEADNDTLKAQLKKEIDARIDAKPISFDEFKKIYRDNSFCLKYLSDLKWSEGFKCRKCRNEKFGLGKFDYSRRCSKCGYEETPTTNTIFYRIKFPILKAFYLFFLWRSHPNLSARELSKLSSIKENTCWLFRKKLISMLGKNKIGTERWESQLLI